MSLQELINAVELAPRVEKTYAMIKPDAMAAGAADDIMHLIENAGFTILASRKLHVRIFSAHFSSFLRKSYSFIHNRTPQFLPQRLTTLPRPLGPAHVPPPLRRPSPLLHPTITSHTFKYPPSFHDYPWASPMRSLFPSHLPLLLPSFPCS